MSRFVLDGSITLAWCFEDESNPLADAVLASFGANAAVVPSLWPLEVANVLAIGERRRRIKPLDSDRFVGFLGQLPISVDFLTAEKAFTQLLGLARQHHLSVYDAAYLELCVRMQLPLSSLYSQLLAAAKSEHVKEFQP